MTPVDRSRPNIILYVKYPRAVDSFRKTEKDTDNEFDETRPSNITQWWNDKRDVRQWYPFWVAISLTVLFGLVQSIEVDLQF